MISVNIGVLTIETSQWPQPQALVGHGCGNGVTNRLYRAVPLVYCYNILKKKGWRRRTCCNCDGERFAWAGQFVCLWLVFTESLPFAPIHYVPLPPTAVRDDASVLLRSSQEVSLDRPAERQHTLAAPACICIAEQRPGNTRSILMTSPHHSAPALPLCLLLKQARSLTRSEKRQASVREQGLARKEEGLLVSE